MDNMDKMLDNILKKDDIYVSQFEKENFILEPLLDEIESIKDDPIRQFVRSLLLNAKEFWEIPSAFSEDQHPPDEYCTGGAVMHTKRMVRVVELLSDSYGLDELDIDILKAAALIHDITKGVILDKESIPSFDHFYPYTLDHYVRQVQKLDEAYAAENQSSTVFLLDSVVKKILRLVRCHLGPWSPIPETIPFEEMEMMLHVAEQISKNIHIIVDGDDIMESRWTM